MKKVLLSCITALACIAAVNSASAQTCDGGRYYSKIFRVLTVSTVTYTDTTVTSQLMDIYQPTGDNATNRKAILIIHGGSFYAGTKTDGFIVYLCSGVRKARICHSLYRLQTGAYL
jgi:acetyl esterase/lipase